MWWGPCHLYKNIINVSTHFFEVFLKCPEISLLLEPERVFSYKLMEFSALRQFTFIIKISCFIISLKFYVGSGVPSARIVVADVISSLRFISLLELKIRRLKTSLSTDSTCNSLGKSCVTFIPRRSNEQRTISPSVNNSNINFFINSLYCQSSSAYLYIGCGWLHGQIWTRFEHYMSRKGHIYCRRFGLCALWDKSCGPIYTSSRSFTMRLCEIYPPVHGLKFPRFVSFIPSVALSYKLLYSKDGLKYHFACFANYQHEKTRDRQNQQKPGGC